MARKKKNGPSSMRMGFGAKAAIQAGVPVTKPRSTDKLNYENFLAKRPGARGRGADLIAKNTPYADALYTLREEGYGGSYCLELLTKNDIENERAGKDDEILRLYSDDINYLREEASSRMSSRAVAEARFWRRREGTEGSAAADNWELFNPAEGAPRQVP